MKAIAILLLVCAACFAQEKFVGGYILMSKSSKGQVVGMKELAALAGNATTLPMNRIWVSFFSPTMVYVPGSNTLKGTGLEASNATDAGFADIKKYIAQLHTGGVEVFISMGGWNYNCFPYTYMRYSVGGYGTHTPNYWKIQQFGQGSLDNCKAGNQYCYVCEPPSEGTSLADFSIFPEPTHSKTWQQAVSYITSNAGGSTPQWDTDIVPGQQWTDSKTGISTMVPGFTDYITKNRDPYADIVYLAKDLGAAGLDIDYEEFWHADLHKQGASTGPWTLDQTVYKYSAIVKDVMINVQSIYPACKVSTAAGAVGAWSGKWWGGNMKGVWLNSFKWFPDVINFMATGANAGGINVMTYDLSDNEEYSECPEQGVCQLDQQVQFYMNTYQTAGITASVGYEVGTPAYPDPTHDPTHQLPLTKTMLSSIISQTQSAHPAGFFWEMFKATGSPDQTSPTETSQAICKAVLGASTSRCSGSIPSMQS